MNTDIQPASATLHTNDQLSRSVEADSITEQSLPVLEFLRRQLDGSLTANHSTHMRYPTAIAGTLGIELLAVESGRATVGMAVDPVLHGNQQGTVHGGIISELADAAFGTAHSTRVLVGESFTTIDLKVNFLRPVWKDRLHATAYPAHAGKTVSHYHCDIWRSDGKLVATAQSVMMTLRGEQAVGR